MFNIFQQQQQKLVASKVITNRWLRLHLPFQNSLSILAVNLSDGRTARFSLDMPVDIKSEQRQLSCLLDSLKIQDEKMFLLQKQFKFQQTFQFFQDEASKELVGRIKEAGANDFTIDKVMLCLWDMNEEVQLIREKKKDLRKLQSIRMSFIKKIQKIFGSLFKSVTKTDSAKKSIRKKLRSIRSFPRLQDNSNTLNALTKIKQEIRLNQKKYEKLIVNRVAFPKIKRQPEHMQTHSQQLSLRTQQIGHFKSATVQSAHSKPQAPRIQLVTLKSVTVKPQKAERRKNYLNFRQLQQTITHRSPQLPTSKTLQQLIQTQPDSKPTKTLQIEHTHTIKVKPEFSSSKLAFSQQILLQLLPHSQDNKNQQLLLLKQMTQQAKAQVLNAHSQKNYVPQKVREQPMKQEQSFWQRQLAKRQKRQEFTSSASKKIRNSSKDRYNQV